MQTLKLTIQYDGTQFLGFQRQKSGRTVQGEIEKAFQRFLNKKINLIGSSRTDSGVHALAQVAHVKISKNGMTLTRIQKALNAHLSKDCVISKIQKVTDDFHARYQAKGKIYEYRLWNSPLRTPILDRHVYHHHRKLDLGQIKKAARFFVGKHDFKSFQSSGGNKEMSTVRTLKRLSIKQEGSLIRFIFEGDGFLYNMVRNIIGTLIWVGEGKISPKEIPAILRLKDRKKAGPNASAKGLFLVKVKY